MSKPSYWAAYCGLEFNSIVASYLVNASGNWELQLPLPKGEDGSNPSYAPIIPLGNFMNDAVCRCAAFLYAVVLFHLACRCAEKSLQQNQPLKEIVGIKVKIAVYT